MASLNLSTMEDNDLEFGYADDDMMRRQPFCVIGHDAHPSSAFSAYHAAAV